MNIVKFAISVVREFLRGHPKISRRSPHTYFLMREHVRPLVTPRTTGAISKPILGPGAHPDDMPY